MVRRLLPVSRRTMGSEAFTDRLMQLTERVKVAAVPRPGAPQAVDALELAPLGLVPAGCRRGAADEGSMAAPPGAPAGAHAELLHAELLHVGHAAGGLERDEDAGVGRPRDDAVRVPGAACACCRAPGAGWVRPVGKTRTVKGRPG